MSRPAELEHQPTMFMAVPTMYAKLAKFAADSHLSPAQQEAVVERCRNIRYSNDYSHHTPVVFCVLQ